MLQIRKKAEDVFKHFNDQGNFLLSRGYFKIDNGVFFIVEAGGARRNTYAISEITVYDDTDSGTPETFTTDIALYERLVELRYNLVETSSGGFVSDLTSSPQDYPFVDTNTFVLPDNYVIVSVHINGSLYKKAEYNKSGNNLLIIDSLEVGDIVEVRGVIAIGSFGTDGATTFLGLTDTPSTYIGQAGKFPKVNAGENGLEFDDVGGSQSFEDTLQVNRLATTSPLIPNATEPTGAVNLQQLETKQTKPIIISANKIAVNDEVYHNTGNNTYTDPTGVTGKGYHVLNVSGSPTIGGNTYSAETYLFRYYDGTNWITNVIKKGVSNAVYSANKTLTPMDNNDTIFMDSGTLTVNPTAQSYQNGYTIAVASSGGSNTPLVLQSATDWSYVINANASIASGSVFIEKGGTATIVRKANLKIFQLNGSII